MTEKWYTATIVCRDGEHEYWSYQHVKAENESMAEGIVIADWFPGWRYLPSAQGYQDEDDYRIYEIGSI